MPNYEVDAARDQIEIMKKEIEEERLFYEGVMKEMQDEKANFEEQQRTKYNVLMSKYEDTQKKLHEKEEYNFSVVKDHVEVKHVFELEERAQNEENEALR